jgi:hypothetical protein
MGLEMVRVGSNQKNLYVEMNEVGINRISSRPHKIYSDSNGIIWIRYKKSLKRNKFIYEIITLSFLIWTVFIIIDLFDDIIKN